MTLTFSVRNRNSKLTIQTKLFCYHGIIQSQSRSRRRETFTNKIIQSGVRDTESMRCILRFEKKNESKNKGSSCFKFISDTNTIG